MASRNGVEMFSVFGQAECVASGIMIERGKAKRIPVRDFPDGAPLFNDVGVPAVFALIVKRGADMREFDRLVEEVKHDAQVV